MNEVEDSFRILENEISEIEEFPSKVKIKINYLLGKVGELLVIEMNIDEENHFIEEYRKLDKIRYCLIKWLDK